MIKQFQKDLKDEDQSKALEIILDFCAKIGLPKEVSESWDVDTLNEFIEFLMKKKG